MSKSQTNTTHYFDGTKWLEATQKSCENCKNYIPMYRCDIPEADMKACLSYNYRNFWIPKEEPKTDRTCETCVNFKSDEKCNFGKPYCSLPYDQTKECLSSLIRQYWYKKEFNEALGFENKQSKKIKPTNTTIHETYELSIKDIDLIFRKHFNLSINDKIEGESVSGDVFRIEIERKQANFTVGG